MSNPNDRPPDSNHPHEANPPGPERDGRAPQDSYGEYQRLRREEDRTARAERVTVAGKFIQSVLYLVGALELLLGLRFILRLTAANPDNTFANFIYGLSQPFVDPFSTLFISPTFNGSTNIFDINLLVAMVAYLVLALLTVQLIRILASR